MSDATQLDIAGFIQARWERNAYREFTSTTQAIILLNSSSVACAALVAYEYREFLPLR